MPEWVEHSISPYRGIDIYVWMPLENFYTAYFLGAWQQTDTLLELLAAIDAYLGEPPLTVYLQPPLDGARLEFRYRSYGLDEFLYPKLSVDGMTFWPQGPLTVYDFYEVRFLAQTVGGVSYLEASTGTFMYQSVPQEITLILEEAGPSSATIKVRGICTGGYPAPSMLLEIYDNDVMIASNDFGVIVIDNLYEFETGVTGAGIHTVYGRMVLTNPLGSFEFTTPTEEFELG